MKFQQVLFQEEITWQEYKRSQARSQARSQEASDLEARKPGYYEAWKPGSFTLPRQLSLFDSFIFQNNYYELISQEDININEEAWLPGIKKLVKIEAKKEVTKELKGLIILKLPDNNIRILLNNKIRIKKASIKLNSNNILDYLCKLIDLKIISKKAFYVKFLGFIELRSIMVASQEASDLEACFDEEASDLEAKKEVIKHIVKTSKYYTSRLEEEVISKLMKEEALKIAKASGSLLYLLKYCDLEITKSKILSIQQFTLDIKNYLEASNKTKKQKASKRKQVIYFNSQKDIKDKIKLMLNLYKKEITLMQNFDD